MKNMRNTKIQVSLAWWIWLDIPQCWGALTLSQLYSKVLEAGDSLLDNCGISSTSWQAGLFLVCFIFFSFNLIFLVSISIPISQVLLFHLLCAGGMINFQNCGYSYSVSQRLLSCRREIKNCHSAAVNKLLGMLHIPVHLTRIDFWTSGCASSGTLLGTSCLLLGQSPGSGEGKERQL